MYYRLKYAHVRHTCKETLIQFRSPVEQTSVYPQSSSVSLGEGRQLCRDTDQDGRYIHGYRPAAHGDLRATYPGLSLQFQAQPPGVGAHSQESDNYQPTGRHHCESRVLNLVCWVRILALLVVFDKSKYSNFLNRY